MLSVGCKFLPSEADVIGYLRYKLAVGAFPPGYGFEQYFMDVDIYQYTPQALTEMHKKCSEDQTEWYFFSPRNRKYQHGTRPNRTASHGYWKAIATDKKVKDENGAIIGYIKILDYYTGSPSSGKRTGWKMHEYILKEQRDSIEEDISTSPQAALTQQLNKWVLCKIYKTKRRQNENNDDQERYDAAALAIAEDNNHRAMLSIGELGHGLLTLGGTIAGGDSSYSSDQSDDQNRSEGESPAEWSLLDELMLKEDDDIIFKCDPNIHDGEWHNVGRELKSIETSLAQDWKTYI